MHFINLVLTNDEQRSIRNLLLDLQGDEENLDEEVFLDRVSLMAHELPSRVRMAFYDFKLREAAPALLVTGNPVLSQDIGPSPNTHWHTGEKRPLNLPQMLHGLYSALLGEPVGFETQQKGRIFNDLLTLQGAPDNASSGSGVIGLHTEDCSQPFMPDYLGLMCLRNDQHAVTTLSSLENALIPERMLDVLFEPVSFRNSQMPYSVLFGDRRRPYLRYGQVDTRKCDNETLAALDYLSDRLQANLTTIVLEQGDCVYIDNFVAVHGRAPFNAEYGPNARWFSRLIMLRDLRRTRSFRAEPGSRLLLKSRYMTATS